MLCDLELLREVFLANWIINPSGEPGRFVAGNKFQEQLHNEMYEHIGRKDRGFNEDYMRKVISPNAYRFLQMKKSVSEGLGLAQRGGKHSEPHTNPEIRKLMQVYHTHQLHLFRSGRRYGSDIRKVDDLGRGQTKLIDGKLKAWTHETTRARLNNLVSSDAVEMLANMDMNIDHLDKQLAETREINGDEIQTDGRIIQTADGELVFEYGDSLGDTEYAEGLEEPEV